MAKPNPENVTKYDSLAIAVATGVPVIDWCKRTGTSRSTASSWQADPDFDADVAMIRRRLLNEAIGKFTGAVTRIAEGMIKLAEDAVSEPTKLNAQRAVFDNLMQMTTFADFERRLAALEQANHVDEVKARAS